MKPQFITCIYSNLEFTRFRGNTDAIYERYKLSLKSLADGGYGIVCYTSASHFDELQELYKDNPNLRLIVHELEDFVHHNKIDQIKTLDSKYLDEAGWRSRCVEIMWGKFYWLEQHLNEIDSDDYLFWIDAGLFHGGLISNTHRSETSKNFFDFDKITQHRNLFNDLSKFTGDKLLNIRTTGVNHGADDFVAVYQVHPEYGVIGGTFGGKKGVLTQYIDDVQKEMKLFLESNKLVKEEELMYRINWLTPDLFADYKFSSWYHEDWDFYNENPEPCFSDFFKVIRE